MGLGQVPTCSLEPTTQLKSSILRPRATSGGIWFCGSITVLTSSSTTMRQLHRLFKKKHRNAPEPSNRPISLEPPTNITAEPSGCRTEPNVVPKGVQTH